MWKNERIDFSLFQTKNALRNVALCTKIKRKMDKKSKIKQMEKKKN
jgi:hypothetical protein